MSYYVPVEGYGKTVEEFRKTATKFLIRNYLENSIFFLYATHIENRTIINY